MCRSKTEGGRRCLHGCSNTQEFKDAFPDLYKSQRHKANLSRRRNRQRLAKAAEFLSSELGLPSDEVAGYMRGISPNNLLALGMSLESVRPGITKELNTVVGGMPGTHNMVIGQVFHPTNEATPSVQKRKDGSTRIANVILTKAKLAEAALLQEEAEDQRIREIQDRLDRGERVSMSEREAALKWEPQMNRSRRRQEFKKLANQREAAELGVYDAMWQMRMDKNLQKNLAKAKDYKERRQIASDDWLSRIEKASSEFKQHPEAVEWMRGLEPQTIIDLCEDSDRIDDTFSDYLVERGTAVAKIRPLNHDLLKRFTPEGKDGTPLDPMYTTIDEMERSGIFDEPVNKNGIEIRDGVKLCRDTTNPSDPVFYYKVDGIDEPLAFDHTITNVPFMDSQRIPEVSGFAFDIGEAPFGQKDVLERIASPSTESGQQFRQGLLKQIALDSFYNPHHKHSYNDPIELESLVGGKMTGSVKTPGHKRTRASLIAQAGQRFNLASAREGRANTSLAEVAKMQEFAHRTTERAAITEMHGGPNFTVANKKGPIGELETDDASKIHGNHDSALFMTFRSRAERTNVIKACKKQAKEFREKNYAPEAPLSPRDDSTHLFALNADPETGDNYSSTTISSFVKAGTQVYHSRLDAVGKEPCSNEVVEKAMALNRAMASRRAYLFDNRKLMASAEPGSPDYEKAAKALRKRKVEVQMIVDEPLNNFANAGRVLELQQYVAAAGDPRVVGKDGNAVVDASNPIVRERSNGNKKRAVRVVMMTNQCLTMSKNLAVLGPESKFQVLERAVDKNGEVTLYVTDQEDVMDAREKPGPQSAKKK